MQAPPAVQATTPERTDGALADLAIATPAPPAVLATTPERTDGALVDLSIAPVTNSLTYLSTCPAPTPASIQATPAPPAVMATTPERTDGALVDLSIDPVTNSLTYLSTCPAPTPASIQATPAPPAVLATTPERTDGALVDLSIDPVTNSLTYLSTCPAPTPASIQATPAPPAVLATTPERTDGALVDLSIDPLIQVPPPALTYHDHHHATNSNTSGRPALPETLASKRLTNSIRRQDCHSSLTDQDGLVVLSKSMFLKKLRLEWRHLLHPKQIHNLCFFFECPKSHSPSSQKESLAYLSKNLVFVVV
jgi:hypothetical protein